MTSRYARSRLAAFAVPCLLVAVPASAAEESFDIPAQPLVSALGSWARQARVQIFFPSKAIRGRHSAALRGRMSARAALDRLIAGSGLRVVIDDGKTVVLAMVPAAPPPARTKVLPKPLPRPEEPEMEEPPKEIIVTGIRRSIESGIATKRRARVVTDAVGAEDVGKFPDENVAESLQRITGVQITRSRGEGEQATIRGLPPTFTQVEFDGRLLPSAIGDAATVARSFNFTSLPSEFVRSLEVYKSTSADMQEGGLAGTVNIRTPQAFDIGRRSLAINAQSTWEDNRGKPGQRLSALYTDVMADRKLGLVLGVTYTKRLRETHAVDFLGFRDDLESLAGGLDLNGDGKIANAQRVEYGNSLYLEDYTEDTVRLSTISSVEFRPNDRLKLHVDTLYSHLDDTYLGNTSLLRYLDIKGPTVPTGIELDDGRRNPRAVKFLSNGIEIRPEGRVVTRKGKLLSFGAGGDFTPGSWTISFEGAYSRSTQVMSNLGIEDSGRFQVGYDITVDEKMIQPVYGPGVYAQTLDPNNYQILTLNGSFHRQLKDELRDFRLDVGKDLNSRWLRAIKLGFRYTDRSLFSDNGRLVLTSGQINALLGGTLPQSIYGPGTYSAVSLINLSTPSRGQFLGSYDGPVQLPGSFLASNTKGFLDRFTDEQLLKAGTYTNDPSGVTDIEERVSAGYVKAVFGDADSLASGDIGVRVVRTDQHAEGVTPDFAAITFEPAAGARTTIPPAGAIVIDRSYTDILPSLNARISLAPKLLARFAASRTMSRPPLEDISPTVTASGTRRTMALGNPYLEPFRSNNLDLSLEWYFANRGLLSAAFFYKDVLSLIRQKTTSQLFPVTQINADGSRQPLLLDFQVSEPVNGKGVQVTGVELSYQQPFTFLPRPFDNLGVIANYTYLRNSDPTQLTGTSRHSFNLSGYYEDRRLSVRLAYTFRDTFLMSSDGAFGDGERAGAFGTLNANITLRITRDVSAVLEGTNLLDTDQVKTSLLGSPLSYEDPGRRLDFGLRARF